MMSHLAKLFPNILWTPDLVTPSAPAWIEHGPFAYWLMGALRPRMFVELGTHQGYSYFAFCQAARQLGVTVSCFAVDTWQGDEHAGFYSDDVYQEVKQYHEDRYTDFSKLIRSTFDQALVQFEDGSIDLLHIDGRHTYEDVKHDFETWYPKLSNRAVVLFHDTNVRERGFGVFHLWEELECRYPNFVFLHGNGLGVLGIGSDVQDPLRSLFSATHDQDDEAAIRKQYRSLGSSITKHIEKSLQPSKGLSSLSPEPSGPKVGESSASTHHRQSNPVLASGLKSMYQVGRRVGKFFRHCMRKEK